MKLSPQWLRDFVDLQVNYHQLADDLTLAGIAVESVSGDNDATVFEMEITTNRPDAMNHYGVARECSALYDLPLKPITPKLPASSGASDFAIQIEDAEGCARYTARIIRGVTIKASPDHVAQRLASVDQRSINNAADASNYTLWEMGHPTHAFDLDLLEGGNIIVRRARDGETLKTLDGVDRKLTSDDLVIADAVKPVALAGVMGGLDTMITEKTKNVLIESAWFDPVTVRKMSKRHGLHTDASHRFERGADYEATTLAGDRVAELILESGGGQLVGGLIDTVARTLDQAPVALRISEVHRVLGKQLDTNEIVRILKRLGFDLVPEPGEDPEFTAQIPSWRLDVEREIDLIEEIARLHGYDKFPNTLPAYAGAVVESPNAAKDEELRSSLLALGYNETVSLTFISHEDAEQFSDVPVLELANPLSEEASVMRTSMLPGMLNMVAYNLNRGTDNVRLFEAGNVFHGSGDQALQTKRICIGATGSAVAAGVHQPTHPLSFFDVKGDVENLLKSFQYNSIAYDTQTADYFHPGRSARAVMDGATVAQFGQLHPDIASARKLRQDVFVGEIYLDQLYKHGLREVRYEPLPKYPAVERDFSFVFADTVIFEQIQKAITSLQLNDLRSFVPVEIFRGGSVPTGKYSLLLRAKFQSNERTLREDEVAEWAAKITKALEGLGGTQRA
ncbi:MAG: phenylalanyl-tRNA synthetase beta subunit [Acidobacteriaceae bacterium]|nr:phenylalanyl-tRNA synthetase beta subunit [Acidobacteriaceae bacterium]